jgi:Flp pilus assembly protein TadD
MRDDYGRALLMSGRVGEAAEQFESARRLAPSDVQVLFELARARLAQGRREDAIALLERARELDPTDPSLRQPRVR